MTTILLNDNIRIEYEYFKMNEANKEDIPIIFLNGTIFNYNQWFPSYLPAFRNFSKNNFNYLIYNYQGIGNSSELDDTYSIQLMVDELVALMDKLQIEKAHLFGKSIGNMLAQMMAGQNPERVKSLSGYGIVSLLGNIDSTVKIYKERLIDLFTLGPILQERITPENFNQVVRTVYTPALFGKSYNQLSLKQKIIHKVIERKVKNMLLGTPVKSMEYVFSYYINSIETEKELYKETLEKIDQNLPILFMHGTEDTTTNLESAKLILDYIPHAEFIEFEGYQHISPALKKKQGREIMKNYVRFLNSIE